MPENNAFRLSNAALRLQRQSCMPENHARKEVRFDTVANFACIASDSNCAVCGPRRRSEAPGRCPHIAVNAAVRLGPGADSAVRSLAHAAPSHSGMVIAPRVGKRSAAFANFGGLACRRSIRAHHATTSFSTRAGCATSAWTTV